MKQTTVQITAAISIDSVRAAGHEGHVMPPASKPPAVKPGKDKPATPPTPPRRQTEREKGQRAVCERNGAATNISSMKTAKEMR